MYVTLYYNMHLLYYSNYFTGLRLLDFFVYNTETVCNLLSFLLLVSVFLRVCG